MNKLFQFLQESNGNLSTARLIPTIVTLAIIFKYVWQVVKTDAANFSVEEITMLLGSFGIKVGQKPLEKKPNEIPANQDK